MLQPKQLTNLRRAACGFGTTPLKKLRQQAAANAHDVIVKATVIDRQEKDRPATSSGSAEPQKKIQSPKPKEGSVLELKCKTLSTTGKGVCRTANNFVVLVPRGVPGETLKAEITKVDRGSARAKKLETLHPSPAEVSAPCSHFPECGGCDYQNISYAVQLEEKQKMAKEVLLRLAKLPNAAQLLLPPIGCEEQYRYRNKMAFSVSSTADMLLKANRKRLEETPTVGLHADDAPEELVEIEDCWLQDETGNKILNLIKTHIPSLQKQERLTVEKIVIRKGAEPKRKTPQYMVIMYTWIRPKPVVNESEDVAAPFKFILDTLLPEVPNLVSMYECRAIVGREKAFPVMRKVHGQEYLTHFAGDLPFRVAPLAFFQTNSHQTRVLMDLVEKAAGLREGDVLTDMFCGVGSLGVSLARRQMDKRQPLSCLRGYDVYNQSIKNARTNAGILGIPTRICDFRSRDLTQPTLGAPKETDVVIVDPSRSGLGDSAIQYLLDCTARTLVYVSCDIATQARDIQKLTDERTYGRYHLESVQICDMFPQTRHIESVAVFRRKQEVYVDDRRGPQSGFPRIIR